MFPRREESRRVYDAVNVAGTVDARGTTLRDLFAHTGLSERRVKGDRRAARTAPASLNGARGVCVSAAHFAMWELERFLHEYENRYAAER